MNGLRETGPAGPQPDQGALNGGLVAGNSARRAEIAINASLWINVVGFLFLFAGGWLISACAIYCHRWSSRLIEKRRYLAVWFGVPVLLVAALLVIPAGMFVAEALLVKYLLPVPYHDDNSPGPCCDGDVTVVLVLLLWPFSALAALIYIIAAFVRSCASIEKAPPLSSTGTEPSQLKSDRYSR
jgi:hypothetical protein